MGLGEDGLLFINSECLSDWLLIAWAIFKPSHTSFTLCSVLLFAKFYVKTTITLCSFFLLLALCPVTLDLLPKRFHV